MSSKRKSHKSPAGANKNAARWGTSTYDDRRYLREMTVAASVNEGPSKYPVACHGDSQPIPADDPLALQLNEEQMERLQEIRERRGPDGMALIAAYPVRAVAVRQVSSGDLDATAQLGADSAPYTGGYRD